MFCSSKWATKNWGKSNDGASLGTDGKIIKVRYSYVDWVIPQTDAKVRMGLQNFSLPGFISQQPHPRRRSC